MDNIGQIASVHLNGDQFERSLGPLHDPGIG